MTEHMPSPPRVTAVQRLWLLELGLDRPMLARLEPNSPARPTTVLAPVVAASAMETNRASATAALATLRHGNDPSRSTRAASVSPRAAGAGSAGPPSPHSTPAEHPVPNAPHEAPKTTAETGLVAGEALATPSASIGNVPAGWAALEARIQSCEICELHTGRHGAVAGSGAVEAVDWLVVGEAPGERDDRFGQPFQGKAGELLHAMLRAAGIDPDHAVFYTNLVKCRPRSNRLPTAAEIAACQPHLHEQIALLRPRGILALGRLAAQALLTDPASERRSSFEALRGKVHQFQQPGAGTIPLVVTYHPASLLSRPSHKAASWRDLNLARTLN